MRLHTVNQAPGTGSALASCLRLMDSGDCLLLLEDGVYAGCAGQVGDILETGCKLFVLEQDADARGLMQQLDHSVELVDYAGFVALAAQCNAVMSWY